MDSWYDLPYDRAPARNAGGWFANTDIMTKLMGLSFISSFLGMGAGDGAVGGAGNAAFMNSIRLLVLGVLVEGGRRLFQYFSQRFKLFRKYSPSSIFVICRDASTVWVGAGLGAVVTVAEHEKCWKAMNIEASCLGAAC